MKPERMRQIPCPSELSPPIEVPLYGALCGTPSNPGELYGRDGQCLPFSTARLRRASWTPVGLRRADPNSRDLASVQSGSVFDV